MSYDVFWYDVLVKKVERSFNDVFKTVNDLIKQYNNNFNNDCRMAERNRSLCLLV